MSPLAILAIVAGVLLAAVLGVGVITAVRTRAMRDRDLALAEALTSEKSPSISELNVRRFGRLAKEADELESILKEAARQRNAFEKSISNWVEAERESQEEILRTRSGRSRWLESTEAWRSFINDLIREGRRPDAGVVLLSVENTFDKPGLVEAVTWYRDQLLSLHPAYLATREPLFKRVNQLTTLTIRMERAGEIPNSD
jgi:hypothetical protein